MFVKKNDNIEMIKALNLLPETEYEYTWDGSQNGAMLCLMRQSGRVGCIVLLDYWNQPQVIGNIPSGVTIAKENLSKTATIKCVGTGAVFVLIIGAESQIRKIFSGGGGNTFLEMSPFRKRGGVNAGSNTERHSYRLHQLHRWHGVQLHDRHQKDQLGGVACKKSKLDFITPTLRKGVAA